MVVESLCLSVATLPHPSLLTNTIIYNRKLSRSLRSLLDLTMSWSLPAPRYAPNQKVLSRSVDALLHSYNT